MGDAVRRNECWDKLLVLRNGGLISDNEFDLVYSSDVRRLSQRHWTPVHIARRVAHHLVKDATTKVLDVGSGPGKFCIVGALTSCGSFFGIEQRRHLVDEAERVCSAFGVPRVEMIHGNMVDLEWARFDAFYLYNPFFENIAACASIDKTVSVGLDIFHAYTDSVRQKLAPLPIGTKVATYHGFGGKFPDGYVRKVTERIGSDYINVWVKEREGRPMTDEEQLVADLDNWGWLLKEA